MSSNNLSNSHSLIKSSTGQLIKYSNPVVRVASEIARFEESVKTVYSEEVNKSIIARTEFEAWDEYDQLYS